MDGKNKLQDIKRSTDHWCTPDKFQCGNDDCLLSLLEFIGDEGLRKHGVAWLEERKKITRSEVRDLTERLYSLSHLISKVESVVDFKKLKIVLLRETHGAINYANEVWDLMDYRHEECE